MIATLIFTGLPIVSMMDGTGAKPAGEIATGLRDRQRSQGATLMSIILLDNTSETYPSLRPPSVQRLKSMDRLMSMGRFVRNWVKAPPESVALFYFSGW